MSLVNDALRKARLEAARQEVGQRSVSLPTLGQPIPTRSPQSVSPATVALLALGVVALFIAFFLVRTGASPEETPEAESRTVADSASASPDLSQSPDQERAGRLMDAAGDSSIPGTASTTASGPRAGSKEGGLDDERVAGEATQDYPQRARRLTLPRAERPTPRADPQPRSGEPTASETAATKRASATTAGNVETLQPAKGEPVSTGTVTPGAATSTVAAPIAVTSPPQARVVDSSAPATSPPPLEKERVVKETVPGNASSGPVQPTESFVRKAEIPGFGVFTLDGIAWSSDRPFALVNGEVVGPGGFVNGATVTEVSPDRVVLILDTRRFELRLR